MSLQYIRLAKTPDVDKVLSYLQNRFRLLSEADILKLALSEIYAKEVETSIEKEQKLRTAFNHALEEGGKIGDKLLAEKGLKKENMSEQEIYDAFLDTHKHNA